jgi:hypothetical protein
LLNIGACIQKVTLALNLRAGGKIVNQNNNRKIISIFIIFLLVAIIWNPVTNIIAEVWLPRTDQNRGSNDQRYLEELVFDPSPAILQYTVPDGTGKDYKTVTRVICGNNTADGSGNRSYIYCFEYEESYPDNTRLVWKYLISNNHSIYSSPAELSGQYTIGLEISDQQ